MERTTPIQHPITVIEGSIETVVMSNLGFVTQCLRINNIERGIITLILFYLAELCDEQRLLAVAVVVRPPFEFHTIFYTQNLLRFIYILKPVRQ